MLFLLYASYPQSYQCYPKLKNHVRETESFLRAHHLILWPIPISGAKGLYQSFQLFITVVWCLHVTNTNYLEWRSFSSLFWLTSLNHSSVNFVWRNHVTKIDIFIKTLVHFWAEDTMTHSHLVLRCRHSSVKLLSENHLDICCTWYGFSQLCF